MEDGEALIAHSDSQGLDREDFKTPRIDDNHHQSYFHHKDDYSDIYFERHYAHRDDVSLFNGSNFAKEINLDKDLFSEDGHHFSHFHPLKLQSRFCSRGSLGPPNFDSHQVALDDEDLVIKDYQKPVESNLQLEEIDHNNNEKKEDLNSSSIDNQIFSGDYQYEDSSLPGFNKNEGKLVFKITRFNKVTQKEKLITKNRRIISK